MIWSIFLTKKRQIVQETTIAYENKGSLFAMRLSLAVGLGMLGLKAAAYLVTDSTAILSDAAESVIHVVAVGFAAYSLSYSLKPADRGHPYGHAKISFFSSGVEGALIVMAALYIVYEAVYKLITGPELENLGWGTALTVLAVAINGALGSFLLWRGRRYHSIILEANGKHVLTDCWTSIGVVVGLSLIYLTGWSYWDPLCALVVAANIMVSGYGLIRRSIGGLMDEADPEFRREVEGVIQNEVEKRGVSYHRLRHRNLGNAYWVDFHILFNDSITIKEAHRIATSIEHTINQSFPFEVIASTHLEPHRDHEHIHQH